MARYDYKGKAHSEWAKRIKAGHAGCVVCGRGSPGKRSGRPPKGQRLHAHHVYGTKHRVGVVLCPTCHKLVDTLAGPGKGVFTNTGKWRRLLKLANQKMQGAPPDCPGGEDCQCH